MACRFWRRITRRLVLSSIVQTPKRDRWAHLRFSIIGSLLASPPAPGSLMASLQALAAKPWRHPDSGLDIRFSTTTLERWYYAARGSADPSSPAALPVARPRLCGAPGSTTSWSPLES